MRVISGAFRGKKLSVPHGITTRPTSDRVKEALFSILASRIDLAGTCVLDICAGTGSLGIEALSRGAKSCCFIECDKSVKAILDKNIMVTCCQDRSEILAMDAVRALHRIAGRGQCYDLVFLDPPYTSEMYLPVIEALDATGLLAPGAILVAECSARKQLPESCGNLQRFDRRVYGETAIDFFVPED